MGIMEHIDLLRKRISFFFLYNFIDSSEIKAHNENLKNEQLKEELEEFKARVKKYELRQRELEAKLMELDLRR
jgi:hypothetical protein